jgi:hypothetical protein
LSLWFRFYSGVVDDPKAQMLTPEMFKHWVNVLCIAAQHDGELPAISVTSFTLRMSEAKVAAVLTKLHSLELLDKTEKSFKPHNWDRRQYKTDSADHTNAERQKNLRRRKRDELNELRALRDTVRNGALRNGVTPVMAKRPETETEITPTVSEDTGRRPTRHSISTEALATLRRV